MQHKIFVIGYPGDIGGANTECWHTLKLWRRFGAEVHLVPTWNVEPRWKRLTDGIGCVTHEIGPEKLELVPGIEGATTVGFCNSRYIDNALRLRKIGCKIVWGNCMTFLFGHERRFFEKHGPADAMVFQSEFQRAEIEKSLQTYGYRPETGHLIRGAFDWEAWDFAPRPHDPETPFTVGRIARPDPDKWSSKTWKIYGSIPGNRRALVMGTDSETLRKLGSTPAWTDVLKPGAIPEKAFYASLHCLMPVNGGARENWPRTGLEAMAAGVPIVAQNQWGWREMVRHGETGFLADDTEELAHYAGILAGDEARRIQMAQAARKRLVGELAEPNMLWNAWERLFVSLAH